VIACAFVAQCPIDDNEIWWRPRSHDLPSRAEAYQQPTAACEQFFGYKHCEWRAHDPSDNAYLLSGKEECIQFGVIAWPACKGLGSAGLPKCPHKVAIGIQQAHRRHQDSWEVLLASRLAQQRGRHKDRRRRRVLVV
jgi:hypothetical protein